jgi:transcriptional regulator with XRE-family HTH domain
MLPNNNHMFLIMQLFFSQKLRNEQHGCIIVLFPFAKHSRRMTMTERDELLIREKFGEKVRYYRELHRWSMEDLAQKIGKTKGTISRIETGKQNVSVAQIMQLADILAVEIEELFPREDKEDIPCSKEETIGEHMQTMAVTLKNMASHLEALAMQ